MKPLLLSLLLIGCLAAQEKREKQQYQVIGYVVDSDCIGCNDKTYYSKCMSKPEAEKLLKKRVEENKRDNELVKYNFQLNQCKKLNVIID